MALLPLLAAAMIAISRCEDYRHDVYDVCTGGLIGISIAYFSYRRYFPRLRANGCAEPFPSRAEDNGFRKVKGDEEAGAGEIDDEDL
jgi:diacylglycerol diphosphate phosphatase/phosphatidate phosphatase